MLKSEVMLPSEGGPSLTGMVHVCLLLCCVVYTLYICMQCMFLCGMYVCGYVCVGKQKLVDLVGLAVCLSS